MSILDENLDITPTDLVINACKKFLISKINGFYGISIDIYIELRWNINKNSLIKTPSNYILLYELTSEPPYMKATICYKNDPLRKQCGFGYFNLEDVLNFMNYEHIG